MSIIEYPTPVYKLGLFSTEYDNTSAVGTDITAANVKNAGWLIIGDENLVMSKYTIEDSISQKSVMNFTMNIDYSWLLRVDMILRCDGHVFYPKSVDANQPSTEGTRLIVMVWDTGDTTGQITIYGNTLENPTGDSETIQIDGEGSYFTTKTFTSISANGVDVSGLQADISVWGLVDLPERRREITFHVDGNDDGYYAKIFGGYITEIRHNPVYGNDTVNIVAHDYTEFLMANQFKAGFRTNRRCTHWVNGDNGYECALSRSWFPVYCLKGDMRPIHPNGTLVTPDDAIYSCSSYTASNEKLPYCGYSFNSDYAPNTDYGYEYYPEDYTRGLRSISTLCNGLEEHKSNPWYPATKATFELDGTHDSSTTTINFKNYTGWGADTGDYILLGDGEFVKITASSLHSETYENNTSGTFFVNRAALKTVAGGYGDGVPGVLWYVSVADMGVTSEYPVIIQTDIGSTIYNMGQRYAETMTQLLETRECVFWVDFNRQLHLIDMDGEDSAYMSTLQLSDDDVLAVSGLGYTDVINVVTGTIEDATLGTVNAITTAEEITGITQSIHLFGTRYGELDTTHINTTGIHDYAGNLRGWKPIAANYLKTHAYPLATQTVTVMNFYPDEWHWTNPGGNYHTPMNYTDPFNRYIDIKGHRIQCRDYNLPSRPLKTWVVESMKYYSDKYREAKVDINMTRLTTEDEWI